MSETAAATGPALGPMTPPVRGSRERREDAEKVSGPETSTAPEV